ncbi:hypothetical protein A6B43_01185 [Vespertiliibacter pulmonis]|uniref:Uncharacterized protein DUF4298 n=1 Tax=Vespertiliibacter pulmonis TaxID=1443036 RepID=A0A3N4WJW3_9PAST|nr:DUF4298 domain-containing protein [Vespertiliibacter pulmonis]QLB20251.1 hypothetical protein A6B43_01185 [Vespertiliibacter pulmonis]RPE86230.1 uncharacterized protein DUF4298 [Vespertiliibacter pulmonis]
MADVDIAYIQKMQDLYGKWVKLQPKLEKNIQQWQEAVAIMAELKPFYSNPKWIELYEMSEDELPLETNGNYSVLSQDALWNAFEEEQSLSSELKEILAKLEAQND